MYFDIDVVIFVTYLIINVGLGLYWGRGNKTIKDYALGGRNFSTSTLVSTIMAAWIGGDYLFITLAQVYTTGLHYAIGCLGMVACLALNAYIFIPRMGEFLGNLSVAEAMGSLYGKNIRIITAISGTIITAGFVAVQFKVFGEIFKSYLGVSSEYAIFMAGFIVIMYSVFGGIRSIAFTDVIQFFTFGVLIPVLSIIMWHQYTNINGFSFEHTTSNPIFNYKEFIGLENPNFWSLALLFLLFSIPDLNPTMFQRIAIGRDVAQVKKAFSIATVLLLFILCGMSWIAFLLFSVNPDLQPTGLVHYIIDNHAHPGLKGFILIGIVSMCMSNADAQLNAASVIITHDLCYPLNIKFNNELVLSRTIGIILGCTAVYLASLDYDLLSLVFMTQSFYIPIIDVPLIFAILGFRSTVKSVLIGMSAGFIGVIIWRIYFMDITGIDSILPGTIINLIFFVGSHYLFKKNGGYIAKK